MKTGIIFLVAAASLLSACDGIPSNYTQGDSSAGAVSGSYGQTSYRTGYGVSRDTTRSGADSKMDWGE